MRTVKIAGAGSVSLLLSPHEVSVPGRPSEIGVEVVPRRLTIVVDLSGEPAPADAVEASQSFSMADALADKGLIGALVRGLQPSAAL